jgi:formyltetrahydrofolate synthetase
VVVAVNKFFTDTPAEIDMVRQAAMSAGADAAVMANHWAQGGKGAADLAEEVVRVCNEQRADPSAQFKFLYPLNQPIKDKIAAVAASYGAAGVEYTPEAEVQIKAAEVAGFADLPVCMAKTQFSLSTDPAAKGVPTGFTIKVREVRASVGAGFLVCICGNIMMVPGLPTRPGFYDVDLDLENDRIVGLF